MLQPGVITAKLTEYNRTLAEDQRRQRETVDAALLGLLRTMEMNKGMLDGFLFVAVGRDGGGIIVDVEKGEVSHGMTLSSSATPDVARVIAAHADDAAKDIRMDLRGLKAMFLGAR